jgi:hypothetical protein
MKKPLSGITFGIMFVGLILACGQAFGFRCGTRLISEGDLKARVVAECGKPTHVEVWEEVRVRHDLRRSPFTERERDRYREPLLIKEYITVEEWTYNRGPNRFMHHLIFENGRLREIIIGEYGF